MMDRLQPQDPIGSEKPSDLDRVVASVKAHPLLYAGGVLALIAAGLGFLFYSTSVQARSEESATVLMRAASAEDPAERLEQLDAATAEAGRLAAEAVYLKGESAFAAEDYDTAKAAFEEVVSTYPGFQFAPDALEGLGYIEEARGNYQGAVVHYLDVQVKYPGTYAARRQHFNLGRAYAAQGMHKEAIDAYRRQVGEFPESVVAARARHELHEYQGSHPDLFQEFESVFTAPTEDETDLVVIPDDVLDTVEVAPAEPVEPVSDGQ